MNHRDIKFVTATPKLVKRFYDGKPPIKTIRGFVAVAEGERVIGIGGISYEGKTMLAFTEMKPEMRKHKKAMARAVRLLETFYNNLPYPVVAFAHSEEPTAPGLLKRLGFVNTGLKTDQGEILVRSPQ